MGSILRRKKFEKIVGFIYHLCDATIIDVILLMCFHAIFGCDFVEKTFDSMRLPSLVTC